MGRWGEPVRPGGGGGAGGWAGGGPVPPGRAPHPQPARPGAPCRQRRGKARGRAAGGLRGGGEELEDSDAGRFFLALSREVQAAVPLTSPLEGLNVNSR